MYFVYFLYSQKTGKFYVGQTSKHPSVRLREHNAGLSRWTNQHKPFRLVYYEKYCCREDAESREAFYKSGVGKQVKKVLLDYFLKKDEANRPLAEGR